MPVTPIGRIKKLMNQNSGMDDELRPEYDFAQMTPIAQGEGRNWVEISIRADAETLAWFQSKGEAAEQHMAAALRIYAEAQKYSASLGSSA